jgi:probable HAF family extracellular repeat protein
MTYLDKHAGTFDDFFNIGFEREDPRKSLIYSEAVDINSSGVIIGNSTTGFGWPDDEEKRAFLWKDGVFTDLTPPPFLVPGPTFTDGEADENTITFYPVTGKYSEAVDINEKGEVVLTTDDEDGRHAYYWNGVDFDPVNLGYFDANGPTGPVPTQAPRLRLLGRIVGADSEAVAINENGLAVVNSEDTVVFHDLNWDVIEPLNHLPGFGAAVETRAVDINDSVYTNNDGIPDGHVIGNSGINGGNPELSLVDEDNMKGFFWDGGAMYPVDDLGGGASEATDLNNKDQVVGAATLADDSFHAILWTLDANKKGVIRDLGTLGGANSFATAINEAGQVTGWAETAQFYEEQGVRVPARHAFLWDQGIMFDLGSHNDFYVYPFIPSFPFSEAVALNASGKVAGNSFTINAHYRGFYLSPVFP